MDKKKYPQPCTSKGPVIDTKKSQDGTNSKQFQKSRRSEPSRTNFSKNDQPRKSNAQKTKTFNKTPKSKGHYYGGAKEDSEVAENEAEHGSVMARGSKKQNFNHLLNFHFAPRNMQSEWNHGNGYSGRHNNRWLPPIQRHKYNIEQFLQANCQFVVTANQDYKRYLNDPDTLVEWDFIQQIIVKCSDDLSCPICLYPPIPGKITNCGHVYCWHCILNYLSYSEKSGQACPVCYQPIKKTKLKSVKIEANKNTLNVGNNITLRLMRREKGSLIATFAGDADISPIQFLSVSDVKRRKQFYSKLLLAKDDDIKNIIRMERDELTCILLEDPESTIIPFVEQALNELSDREKLLQITDKNSSNHNWEENSTFELMKDKIENEKTDLSNNLCSASGVSDSLQSESSAAFNDPETQFKQQKIHYFYQVDDGQNAYLHAMNVKMLEMQFGSLEQSPLTISGKLIEKEVGSFTEDSRRRMRYLAHLPITSEIEIVEIDLGSIVSDEVLKSFQGQMNDRQKKRKMREREEQKREKTITEEENKRMGKYPTRNMHIESHKDFPQFQSENFEIREASSTESVSNLENSFSATNLEEPELEVQDNLHYSESSPASYGVSFAQMVQSSSSQVPSIKIWPTSTKLKKDPKIWLDDSLKQREECYGYDAESEEFTQPSNLYLSDVMGEALGKALIKNNGSNDNVTGKKKKKKPKATVLFSTAMSRAS